MNCLSFCIFSGLKTPAKPTPMWASLSEPFSLWYGNKAWKVPCSTLTCHTAWRVSQSQRCSAGRGQPLAFWLGCLWTRTSWARPARTKGNSSTGKKKTNKKTGFLYASVKFLKLFLNLSFFWLKIFTKRLYYFISATYIQYLYMYTFIYMPQPEYFVRDPVESCLILHKQNYDTIIIFLLGICK